MTKRIVAIYVLAILSAQLPGAKIQAQSPTADQASVPDVSANQSSAAAGVPETLPPAVAAEPAAPELEALNAPRTSGPASPIDDAAAKTDSWSLSDESFSQADFPVIEQLEPVVIDDVLIGEEILELSEPAPGEEVIIEEVIVKDQPCEPEYRVGFGDWVGYNATQTNTTWLAGGDFGMFSMESFPALKFGKDSSIRFGSGLHFLNGPSAPGVNSPDMPPRLFDLQMAFQARKAFSERTMLDIRIGTGIFTDFEGSARKGVRFPSHLVAYHEHSEDYATVLGVDVLDRDDISVLPVAGFICRPHDDLIFECVFPRPRVELRLSNEKTMYLGAELGGGTWAIERDLAFNDNATYRDIRLTWGITSFDDDDSTMELGWAFDRRLEYRSGLGDTNLDGAFILRWHKHY